MADEVKFSEEELTQVQEIADTYTNLQNELGRIGAQEIIMAQRVETITDRKAEIEKEWKTNQLKEQDLVKTLSGKYGDGSLDPQTGTFVPNSSQKENK
mgnify:CR=1 FL=1